LAGAASALLPPWLPTTAADLAALLSLVRAASSIGQLADERLVHDCFVDWCSEDIVAQLNLADLCSGHVMNWY
jgi:hypothetical protein